MDEAKSTRIVFAMRFTELRIELGMNQSTYAEYLGLSRAHVSFYEKAGKDGGRLPDLVNLRKICSKLHVTADYLLGLSDVKSIGKYMSKDIMLDALSSLGFSQEEALALMSCAQERPYDNTIAAIGSIVNTHSSQDFFATWNQLLSHFEEDLLFSEPGSAMDAEDIEFFKKKLGASGFHIVGREEYREAFINYYFDKQITPALKTVAEEILLKSQEKDRLLRNRIRTAMGLEADN